MSLRVLLVSRGFPPTGRWGTEFYTHQLARGLRASGHDVEVFYATCDRTRRRYDLAQAESDGFRVHNIANCGDPSKRLVYSYSDPQLERVFEELLRRVRPDVVHFHYLLWGLSSGMPAVCRRLGIPTVLTVTDFGFSCHRGQMFDADLRQCGGPHPPEVCARCIRTRSRYEHSALPRAAKRVASELVAAAGGLGRVVTARDVRLREQAMSACLDAVDHLIAPTHVLERSLRAAGVPADKLTRLVYGLEEEQLAAARAEPEGRTVRIGFLGQIAPHKGPDVLMAAARIMSHRLPESVEPWSLYFYGDCGPGRNRLFPKEVFGRDVPKRVFVCAPFEARDLPRVLAELHAIVVPSRWAENAPLTILQARAAGVPVIGSDEEGIREVIEPGVHGLLFPSGDAQALADALREVVLRKWRRLPPSPAVRYGDHIASVEQIYARCSSSGAVPAEAPRGADMPALETT